VDDFTATFYLQNVCSECPATISQHTGNPLALIPLFRGGNVLVKSLSLLIPHCPEILGEEV